MSGKEHVGIRDQFSFVLKKADGSEVTNVLENPITSDDLLRIAKEMGIDVDEE